MWASYNEMYSVLLPSPSPKPFDWQNSFYEIFIVDSVIKSNSLVKIIALSQSPTTLQKLKRLNAFTKCCSTMTLGYLVGWGA